MRFALFGFLCLSASPAFSGDEDDWGTMLSVPAAAPAKHDVSSAILRRSQLLKVRANGLYRARKYREAADLYSACARLDPNDANARNDIAGCYQKMGFKDSALACAREALRLADAGLSAGDAASWSYRDLRARKSAYFLIDKLGAPMTAPKPGECETWAASEGACRAGLRVCSERGSRAAAGGTLRWDVLRTSAIPAQALFKDEETDSAGAPRPEMRDMEAASIDGTPESFSRWVNRDSASTIPLGEYLEGADPACSGPACGGLEKELSECRILHFDACAGVIGMACAYQEDAGPDHIVIGEGYFLPAR